jgi:hypothetical protein
MSGEHRTPNCTLVRSNDRFVTASINLGDLLYIRPYASWHQEHALFEARFRHGSVEMDIQTVTAFVRKGQEALAAAPQTADCSGADFEGRRA